jgi:5-methylcytosine-specific restriction endonuclease McrA
MLNDHRVVGDDAELFAISKNRQYTILISKADLPRLKAFGRKWSVFRSEPHHVRGRERQYNRCLYCDEVFGVGLRPTADHILAIVDGGTNWAFNIVMACRSCNSR